MRYPGALLAVLLVMSAACAAGAKEHARGEGYPPERYMKAEGTGRTEAEAANQARAELSRIFSARVTSETMDRVSSVIGGSGEEVETQSIQSEVHVVSDVALTGVEVAGIWREGEVFRALAVLDKLKARGVWVSELYDLDGRIAALVASSENGRNDLLSLRSLRSALSLWIEREVVASRLHVVGSSIGGVPEYDRRDLYRRVADLRHSIAVLVDIRGDGGDAARAALRGALATRGYVLTDNRPEAGVLVEGTLVAEPLDLPNPDLRYVRVSLTVSVRDAGTGLVLGDVTESVRESHLTLREAEERARRAVFGRAAEGVVRALETEVSK
jgi:hypothetical protein